MTTATSRQITGALLILSMPVLAGCDVSVGNSGLSIGLLSGRARDEWTRTYQLGPGGRVAVINVNGTISVEAAEGPSVEVRAEREAKATSDAAAKELLGKIEIHEESGPNEVRIETRAPSSALGASQEVRYTVKVPRASRIAIETMNGNLTLRGLQGEARATSTNGSVNGQSLSGNVDARTTNGAVRLDLSSIDKQTIKAEVVNGGVELKLPASAHADISASTVNGAIHVSGLNLEETVERTRRRLEARLNGGGARIELDVTNGAIRLTGKPDSDKP